MRSFVLGVWLVLAGALGAPWAGEADVLDVRVTAEPGGYRFDVLVQHADEGWDHYADRFDVMLATGEVLATRTLHHPHVDEQPFRRSLSAVSVPDDVTEVVVRAHDSVHGHGGAEVVVPLPAR